MNGTGSAMHSCEKLTADICGGSDRNVDTVFTASCVDNNSARSSANVADIVEIYKEIPVSRAIVAIVELKS